MPTSLHGKTHGTVGAAQHGLSAVLGRRPCPAWWSALHALPQRRERCRSVAAWSRIAEFEAEDVVIDRPLETTGVMTVTTFSPNPRLSDTGEGLGLDEASIQELGFTDVGENDLKVRLYTGRILRGELQGARVILKAYPQPIPGSYQSRQMEAMATNELVAHYRVQAPCVPSDSRFLAYLLGALEVERGASKGEQWLLFENRGIQSAAQYADAASKAFAAGRAVGEGEFWDKFEPSRPLRRRKLFITKIIRHVFEGLCHLHKHDRLHQSLGPTSVVLNTIDERDVTTLTACVRDLAFSVDVTNEALLGGATLSDIYEARTTEPSEPRPDEMFSRGLWRRAETAGARTAQERRAFGKADDIYAAGLLVAFLCFIPLCAPGSIDAATILRIFESTFRLDFEAIREYADADPAWEQAIAFLGAADGAGWSFVQSCMAPDWMARPTARACLQHPFLLGAALKAS